MKKWIRTVLLVLFCGVFLFSGFMFLREQLQRRAARQEFEELAALVEQTPVPTPSVVPTPAPTGEEQPQVTPTPAPKHKRDIAALQEMNDHCIGWVCIPETEVNYPVMYTPQEPQYYLRLNFQQRYSVAGTPFMDYRCTLDSENIIIYGHNMNDGSMFGTVLHYLDEEYLAAHPVVELETAEGCRYYRVVQARRVDPYDPWYSYGAQPGQTQYLTLSTCDETGGARVLLVAELIA